MVQHEESQNLRRDGKLIEARDALLACSQAACPSAVRADCADWLNATRDAIPSVVVKARVRGKDELDVRVIIDGTLVTSRLDGKAIELNPGQHTIRFEAAAAPPDEQQLLIVEGEKNRLIAVSFGAEPVLPAPARAEVRPEPSPVLTHRPIPPLAFVLAGGAALGAGGFAAFGLWGRSDKAALTSSCSPTCDDSEVSPVRTKFILADASLAFGIVSLAAATYVYVTRPTVDLDTSWIGRASKGASRRDPALPAPLMQAFSIDFGGEF